MCSVLKNLEKRGVDTTLLFNDQWMRQFNERQKAQIWLGAKAGLDFTKYANKEVSAMEMMACRLKLMGRF